MRKHGHAFAYHHKKCDDITEEHLFQKAELILVHDEVEIVGGCRVLGKVNRF